MRALIVLSVLLTLLPAAASHGSWTHCDTTDRTLQGQSNTFYWGIDGPNLGVYLYQETNGIADLQRGGASRFFPLGLDTDACDEATPAEVAPDTLLF